MNNRNLLEELLNIPYDRVKKDIVSFIKNFVDEAGVKGVVVGVSGGVDSSTTLALTVEALGKDNVIALIMPDKTSTPKQDIDDALEIIKRFNVKHYMFWINDVVDSIAKTISGVYDPKDYIALGNVKARVRMIMLYYVANRFNLAVVGASDRSEILLGYFTKYGDGGVDVLPLGGLYKSQVRRLALTLGIPEKIALKPSSPRLWPGHTAVGELGVDYDVIDQVLYGIFDLKLSPREVHKITGIPMNIIDDIMRRVKSTEHKRRTPPTPPPASQIYLRTRR